MEKERVPPPPREPAPADDTAATGRDVPIAGLNRCPWCHDACAPDSATVCQQCLARHHPECWEATGACSSCRSAKALQPAQPPAIAVTAEELELVRAGRTEEAVARVARRAGVDEAAAARALLEETGRRLRSTGTPAGRLSHYLLRPPQGSRLEVSEEGHTLRVEWGSMSATDWVLCVLLCLIVVTIPLVLWVLWIAWRERTCYLVLHPDRVELLEMRALGLLPPVRREVPRDEVLDVEVQEPGRRNQLAIATPLGQVQVWGADAMTSLSEAEVLWLRERLRAWIG